MLGEIAIYLKKVREEDRHKEILCIGMIAESDVVILYEQLAALTEQEEV